MGVRREILMKETLKMNLTFLQPERRGNVENKNSRPVNIRFFAKTSGIRNLSQSIRSDAKTSEVATL